MTSFQRATKEQAKLRAALIGPAGSGKTYTGLLLASALGSKTAVIDTEHGSASKYASLFQFDTVKLTDFSPEAYIALIHEAAGAYDALLIDSLTHEWKWCLEEVDNVKARMKTSNSFVAWKDITPRHNALTEAILQADCHVIATMRAKTEYIIEQDEKGRSVPRKIGMAPVQRDGMEFEFDLIGDLDVDNTLVVSKTRCPELAGKVIRRPGKELAETLKAWLGTGTVPARKAAPSNPKADEKTPGDGGAANQDLITQLRETLTLLGATESLKSIQEHADDRPWLERQLKRAAEAKATNMKAAEQTKFPIPPSAAEKVA